MAINPAELATSTAAPPAPVPAETPAEPAAAPAPASEGQPAAVSGENGGAGDGTAVTDKLHAVRTAIAEMAPEQKREVLRLFDPDEAIRLDDRLSGKLGKLAQQQAQREAERLLPQYLDREVPRILAELDARNAQQQEAERRRNAVQQGDAFGALEILKGQHERENQALLHQQQESARLGQLSRQQLDQAWANAVREFEAQPEPVRERIGYGKQYGPDPVAALAAFNRDIADAKAEHLAAQKADTELRPKLEEQIRRDLEPALRKQILAELNGAEPSPDTGGGSPPVGDFVSQDEWDRNKRNRAWVRQNLSRAKAAMFAGRLTA